MTPKASDTATAATAGWLLLGAILASMAHGAGLGLPPGLAGGIFWLAGLLLAGRVSGLQRTQTLLMFAVGASGLLYAWLGGGQPQWQKALSSNQALLAMLAGVSFLRLISLPAVDDVAPELVIISAGFDAHANDPLANLNWTAEAFRWVTGAICEVAEAHAGGRVVSTLEGGYDLDALAASTAAHVRVLMERGA